jgi:hypothetical protein
VVSICHCLDCQRRTGSAFGIAGGLQARPGRDTPGRYSGLRARLRRGRPPRSTPSTFCPACGSQVFLHGAGRARSWIVVSDGERSPPRPSRRRPSRRPKSRRHLWIGLPRRDAALDRRSGIRPRPLYGGRVPTAGGRPTAWYGHARAAQRCHPLDAGPASTTSRAARAWPVVTAASPRAPSVAPVELSPRRY